MKKTIPAPTPDVVLPPNSNHEYFKDFESHPFRFSATAFELVNAWWLAEASLLAYADSGFVTPRYASAGLELAGQQPISGFSTHAHNDDFVIVAFRGTQVPKLGENQDLLECLKNSVSDIYADVKFQLVDAGGGFFVHRGFLARNERSTTPRRKTCKSTLN